MPYLIGILLDVSESMEYVFESFKEDYGDWPRSVFSVVNDLVGKSVSPGNDVFAIGFGTKTASGEFDITGSLQNFRETYDKALEDQNYDEILKTFKSYVDTKDKQSVDHIKSKVPFYLLKLVSDGLANSEKLRKAFKEFKPSFFQFLGSKFMNSNDIVDKTEATLVKMKTIISNDNHIRELLLKNEILTFDFATAIGILQYWLKGKKMNDESIREFMQNVEPFIYGSCDLIKTLQNSGNVFAREIYKNHKKFLFVLSTGKSTEEDALLGQITQAKIMARDEKIKIVSCYISGARGNVDPVDHTLFASEKEEWDVGARALFRLSSGITTKLLPHAIFRARKWKIEKTNDEIKLFLQINHPDHIQEACNLASEVVGSQDALLDILGNISLAKYIKTTHDGFTAQKQVGKTCYANATAAVLHLAMKRIINRKDGYPKFKDIRELIIEKYGKDGADTISVLKEICPSYRLKCMNVEVDAAIEAITMGRTLVAIFSLTDEEWVKFGAFFANNPKGVLTKNELNIDIRRRGSKTEGHAVVLASFNSECFRFMNSWGGDWGDLGFFRVKNEKVLGITFIDVFWSLDDLFPEEKAYFEKHGAFLAKNLLKRFTDLDEKVYTCPMCTNESKVNSFNGTLVEACCPKCEKKFKCSNDIVMNLYLSSILQ